MELGQKNLGINCIEIFRIFLYMFQIFHSIFFFEKPYTGKFVEKIL